MQAAAERVAELMKLLANKHRLLVLCQLAEGEKPGRRAGEAPRRARARDVLYTSVTAFLAMVPMAIWGGSAVESFAVPMVFGIVVAASSTVFIAAPILLLLVDWRNRRRVPAPQEAPAGA